MSGPEHCAFAADSRDRYRVHGPELRQQQPQPGVEHLAHARDHRPQADIHAVEFSVQAGESSDIDAVFDNLSFQR